MNNQKIIQFIESGEFDPDENENMQQLIGNAGDLLDSASSHDICGSVLFKAADGKFYAGTVEFDIGLAAKPYLIDLLADGDHCECQNCGHIDLAEELGEISDHDERVGDGEEEPEGECTKCRCLSHVITKARATEIASHQ